MIFVKRHDFFNYHWVKIWRRAELDGVEVDSDFVQKFFRTRRAADQWQYQTISRMTGWQEVQDEIVEQSWNILDILHTPW